MIHLYGYGRPMNMNMKKKMNTRQGAALTENARGRRV
jgi:hypothetical protein